MMKWWVKFKHRWSPWILRGQIDLLEKTLSLVEGHNRSLSKENIELGKCCVDAARIEVAREVCKIFLKDVDLAKQVIMKSATMDVEFDRRTDVTHYKFGVGPFLSYLDLKGGFQHDNAVRELCYNLAVFLSKELQEGMGNESTNVVAVRGDWRYWNG